MYPTKSRPVLIQSVLGSIHAIRLGLADREVERGMIPPFAWMAPNGVAPVKPHRMSKILVTLDGAGMEPDMFS